MEKITLFIMDFLLYYSLRNINKIMPEKTQVPPVLIAIHGPLSGNHWNVEKELLIGREAGCDLVIPLREVSRQHALISKIGEEFQIEDLQSKNGTFIENHPIQKVPLLDGGVFNIAGIQEFQFICSDATIPLGVGWKAPTIQLDDGTRQVFVRERLLDPPLSPQQFSLLQILSQNIGGVVSRQAIIDAVWGEDQAMGVTEQALDALIRRLRDRLGEVDPGMEYITTVRGHGVMLENK